MRRFRVTAFSIHFLASVTVILLFLFLVLLVWYPSPLSEVMSVWRVIGMVVFVDIILGPSLTALVANPNKARSVLARDLSVIVVVQLLALGVGIATIYTGRPVYLAFDTGKYFVMTRSNLLQSEKKPGVVMPGIFQGPKMVYVGESDDPKEALGSYISKLTTGGSQATYQPELYRPFDDFREDIYRAGVPYQEMAANTGEQSQAIEKIAQKYDKKELLFYVVIHSDQLGIIVMDKSQGRLVAYLDQAR